MIGADVARSFQRAEREVVRDEDVVQRPAEPCREIGIEGGKKAAPDPRVPQCSGALNLPGRTGPWHVVQVAGQNGRPALSTNLSGDDRELGVSVTVSSPGRGGRGCTPWNCT